MHSAKAEYIVGFSFIGQTTLPLLSILFFLHIIRTPKRRGIPLLNPKRLNRLLSA